MKIDTKKLMLAMARACMNRSELAEASGIELPTLNSTTTRGSTSPATLGRISKALGVDPAEIISEED
ncbi:hypothetical protein DSECCO2_110830 [anaerobic digester metagenome]